MDQLSLANLGFSLLAGSLTTLSPCVLPLLPLVVGGAMQANRLAPLYMAAGMASAFALIGVLLGALGASLGLDADVVRSAGALMLVAMGLVMLWPGLNERLAGWLQPLASGGDQLSRGLDGRSAGSAFLLGATLGLIWSPCSGPVLGSILALVARDGGAVKGGLMLAVFGLGAAAPLVVVAYSSRSVMNKARQWLMQHMGAVKRGFGMLVLAIGMGILSGADKWLEAHVVALLPDAWVTLTTRF